MRAGCPPRLKCTCSIWCVLISCSWPKRWWFTRHGYGRRNPVTPLCDQQWQSSYFVLASPLHHGLNIGGKLAFGE